jgi:phospholipid transport system substrate-binding protein
VLGSRDGGKAGVLVQTTAKRPGKENVAIDWQVSARSGSPKVVNLVIEGVSMLASERAQVGAMLDGAGGSVDGLIRELRARA